MPFLLDITIFKTLIFVGVSIAGLSFLSSGLAYRGKQGEAYSPLNHFISELGYVGVSRLAWVFNLGLILTGLCLLPACISLGLWLPGTLAKISMVIGIVYAISVTFVGIFPMSNIKPHTMAAMTFFWSGLFFIIIVSLAIGFQPRAAVVLPRVYALAGLPAVIAYGVFIYLLSTVDRSAAETLSPDDIARPRVWGLAIAEWMTFVTIVIWFLIVGLGIS